MVKQYPLFDIFWDEEDIEIVNRIIRRGSYWAAGPEIREFEERLEDYFGVKYAIVFNSGTSALHSLLLAHGIDNSEIIVPSLSFISTANTVILAGAKPVFAEIEDDTIGLDPDDVNEKITSKTRAIIPMHYGGRPCKNIEILAEIAQDNNLLLIEDNAESFSARYNNKYTGTFGDSSISSFCQNKIITTGEGGVSFTNDEEIYKKLLLIRSHGRVEQPGIDYFSNIKESDYIEIGYNFRIPTICAALGISQLNKVEKIIGLRRKIGKRYDEYLKDIPEIQLLAEDQNSEIVYQLYSFFLKNPSLRNDLQKFLKANGIFSKVYFPPIHLKTYYKKKFGYREGSLPITEKVSKRLLTIPFSLKFSKDDQDYIANKINEFFIQFRK